MKLIRCTHEPPANKQHDKLIFNSNLNEDLNIDKNSQVALQSISFEAFNKDFVVNSTNAEITFNIVNDSTAYERTVFTEERTYRPSEFGFFTEILSDDLNSGLDFISPFMGLEFRAYLGDNNHLNVEMARGELGTDRLLFKNVSEAGGQYTPDVVPINNNCFMFMRKRLCRGCGYLRIVNVDRTQDFFMGLTEEPFSSQDTNVDFDDIKYGIKLDSLSNTYQKIVNGVATATAEVPQDNDTVEIHIDQGDLDIGFYRNGSNVFIQIESIPDYIDISGNNILYPVVVLENQNTILSGYDFTETPFEDPQVSITSALVTNDLLVTHLNAPTPGTNDFQFNLEFETLEFAQNLGFLDRITQTVNIYGDPSTLIAPKKFDQNNHHDHFIVELDNVLLKSYDDQKKGRLNILAVTSESDENLIFRFRPPYPTFMDIDNLNKMSMRNIRMKVLDENLEIIETVGKSVAVLLFKDKDEK